MGKHVHRIDFRVQVEVDAERLSATTARLEHFLGLMLTKLDAELRLDVLNHECEKGFCDVPNRIVVTKHGTLRTSEVELWQEGKKLGWLDEGGLHLVDNAAG